MRNLSLKQNISLSMRSVLIGLPVMILLGAVLLLGQSPATPAPATNDARDPDLPTITQDVTAVQAPVIVLDHGGSIVRGLNALDFKLYDNGREQKITEDLSEHPISVVVAIQANSGVEKILPQIRKSGSLFDTLVAGDNGEVAVIAFDHRIQTLTNFTSDPDQIHQAFSGKDKNGFYILKSGSSTSALNDATMAGIRMLGTRDKMRKRVLIMISENRDQGSGLRLRDVLTQAEFNNVEIYSLNISQVLAQLTATPTPSRPNTIPPGGQALPNGQVMTPTLDQQLNNNGDWSPVFKDIFLAVKSIFVTNPLNVYSRYTGAREFPFYTQKGLEEAIDKIGQDLHSQYILTYVPDNRNEAGYHTIRVTVDRADLKVISREGWWTAEKNQ